MVGGGARGWVKGLGIWSLGVARGSKGRGLAHDRRFAGAGHAASAVVLKKQKKYRIFFIGH